MRLSVPLEKCCTIQIRDSDPFTVTFRQPTQGDSLTRADQVARMEVWNMERVRLLDVYYTLRGCDIEKEEGAPLWDPLKLERGKLSLVEFERGWNLLSPEVAWAIWESAMEVAPSWDLRPQREEEKPFRQWMGAAPAPEAAAP